MMTKKLTNTFLSITILTFLFGSNVIAQTCFITKTGEKYHTSNCSYLKYSKYSIDLYDAINQGYTACSRCEPTVEKLNKKSSPLQLNPRKKSNPSDIKCPTVRCSGKTQKGQRCKNRISDCSGKCHHHRNQ